MKLFEQYFLDEATSDFIKKLDALQSYWNDNAEKFMSQSDPLFPMFVRPFDRIRKNGVLVVGLNPRSNPKEDGKNRKKLVDFFDKSTPIFDPKTRIWKATDFDSRTSGKEKDVASANFDIDDWKSRGAKGLPDFQKNFLGILDLLEREDLKKHLHQCNLVPFASAGKGAIPTDADFKKLCQKWLLSFVETCQPRVIVLAGNDAASAIEPLLTEVSVRRIASISGKTGKEKGPTGKSIGTAMRVSKMGSVPVIQFFHWSRAEGKPSSPTWKSGPRLKAIQKIFNHFVK